MKRQICMSVLWGLCFGALHLEAAVSSSSLARPAAPARASSTQTSSTVPTAETITTEELNAWLIESAKVAQDYVQLIDQGRYAETWTRGAKLFQKTISQGEWTTALNLARKPLGAVKSRTLKDQKPAWDPKGMPKGAYMVVDYKTSFARAPNSGELLTLMRESNGTWKVLTYQVN